MDTDKILPHFNVLLYQNVTQLFQNPLIHQKCQNDLLCGNVNMDISPNQVIILSAIDQISQQVFHTPVKKR